MKVFIVYTEYQDGEPAIEGVYANATSAAVAAEKAIHYQETVLNNRVWQHVPEGEDADEWDESEWDVDVHIEEYEVKP